MLSLCLSLGWCTSWSGGGHSPVSPVVSVLPTVSCTSSPTGTSTSSPRQSSRTGSSTLHAHLSLCPSPLYVCPSLSLCTPPLSLFPSPLYVCLSLSLCTPPLSLFPSPLYVCPSPSLCTPPLSLCPAPSLYICPSPLSVSLNPFYIYAPPLSLCLSPSLSIYTPHISLCPSPFLYAPPSLYVPSLYTPPPLSVTLSILFCVTIFNLSSVVFHLQQLFHQCLFSALLSSLHFVLYTFMTH